MRCAFLTGAKTAAGLATSCRLHRGRLAPGCSRVHMHPPQIKRQRYHHVHSVMGRRCCALAHVSRCLDGDRPVVLICCSDSAVGSSLVPGQRNSQQMPIDLRVTRAADTTLSDPNWAPAAAVPLRWPRSPWQQHRPGYLGQVQPALGPCLIYGALQLQVRHRVPELLD